jgi:hypothetical protein
MKVFFDYRSCLFFFIGAFLFDELDFGDFKLRESHKRETRKTNEHHLKRPKAHVRDRRKSVVTNILAARLICIAAKRALK